MPQEIANGLEQGIENELEEIAVRLATVKLEEALKDPATLGAGLRKVGHEDLARELEVREGLAEQPAEQALGGDEAELVDLARAAFRQVGYRPVGG